MSFKSMAVTYTPKPMVSLAKRMRRLARLQAAKRFSQKLCNGPEPIKLELGSGDKAGSNGWTTLDIGNGCDMYCDLTTGIPFPDNSIAAIYSSHLFEHLTYQEAQILLDECLRALAPGGTFSICVPNARLYLSAYIKGEAIDADRFLAYKPAYYGTTNMDYVNYIAYMDGQHKYMFDEDNLVYILSRKGFRDVHIREFDESIDMKKRQYQSIYAEGYK